MFPWKAAYFFSSGWRRSIVGRSHAGDMLSAAVLDYGSSIRSIFFHTFGLLKPCFYERLNFFSEWRRGVLGGFRVGKIQRAAMLDYGANCRSIFVLIVWCF